MMLNNGWVSSSICQETNLTCPSYHCTQPKYFTLHCFLKIHCYFTYSAHGLHILTTLTALLASYCFIITSLHELFLDEDPVSNLRNLICCTSNHFIFSVQSLDFESKFSSQLLFASHNIYTLNQVTTPIGTAKR